VPIKYDSLINFRIPEVEQTLTKRDTILYALGVGLGADPLDDNQLKFVYEEILVALPTMAIVMACPGGWHADGDIGITRTHTVHGAKCATRRAPSSCVAAHRRRSAALTAVSVAVPVA
jgi:hypothetical protein